MHRRSSIKEHLDQLDEAMVDLVSGWRHAIPQQEMQKFDMLMGEALLSDQLRQRLLVEKDEKLFEQYALSSQIRQMLRMITVSSLTELAQAILTYHELLRTQVLSKAS